MKKTILTALVILLLAGMLSAQVNTEKFRKTREGDGLEFKAGLAMALYKGNTDIFRFSTDINFNYFKGKTYLFLIGNLTYGEKNENTYINKGFAHLRLIRKFSEHFMFEIFGQEEFNEFIRLKRRDLVGTGIRFLVFKSGNEKSNIAVSAGTGAMWEQEQFNDSNGVPIKATTSLFKSTSYLSIIWKLNERVKTGAITYFQTNVGKESSTRVYSDFNLDVKLIKVLSFTTSINYRYDNNPPKGIKNYDLQIKNGLALTIQ